MARTRSQPISPGGLKSLEDVPRQRRTTRSTANSSKTANAPTATAASASTDNPKRRVAKKTGKSTTRATKKRGAKKATQVEQAINVANEASPSIKIEQVDSTPVKASVHEATAEPAARSPAKSEHNISSTQSDLQFPPEENPLVPMELDPVTSPTAAANDGLYSSPPETMKPAEDATVAAPRERPTPTLLEATAFRNGGRRRLLNSMFTRPAGSIFYGLTSAVAQFRPTPLMKSSEYLHLSSSPTAGASSPLVSEQAHSPTGTAIGQVTASIATSSPTRSKTSGGRKSKKTVDQKVKKSKKDSKYTKVATSSATGKKYTQDLVKRHEDTLRSMLPHPKDRVERPQMTSTFVTADGSPFLVQQSVSIVDTTETSPNSLYQPQFTIKDPVSQRRSSSDKANPVSESSQSQSQVAQADVSSVKETTAAIPTPKLPEQVPAILPIVIDGKGRELSPFDPSRRGRANPLLRYAMIAQATNTMHASSRLAKSGINAEAKVASPMPTASTSSSLVFHNLSWQAKYTKLAEQISAANSPAHAHGNNPSGSVLANNTTQLDSLTRTAYSTKERPTCPCCSAILVCPKGHVASPPQKSRSLPQQQLTFDTSVNQSDRKRPRTDDPTEQDEALPLAKRRETPSNSRSFGFYNQNRTFITGVNTESSSSATDRANAESPVAQTVPATPSSSRWNLRGLMNSVSKLFPSFGEQTAAAPNTTSQTSPVEPITIQSTNQAIFDSSPIQTSPTPATTKRSPLANVETVASAPAKSSPEQIDTLEPGLIRSACGQTYSLRPRPIDRTKFLAFQKDEEIPSGRPQSTASLPAAGSQTPKSTVPKPRKRKRSPTPESIPNPPGVSYGMWDKYFGDVSDSEEEEEELPQSQPPKSPLASDKGTLRGGKRVRFDVQDTVDESTPSRNRSGPSEEVDHFDGPSDNSEAPPTRWPSPPITNVEGTFKLDYDLFSSSDDEEVEAVRPAEAKVPQGTFALRWPAPKPFTPVHVGGVRGVPDPGLFGREFDRLRGKLTA